MRVFTGLSGQCPGVARTFVCLEEKFPGPVALLTLFRATDSFSALARSSTSPSYVDDKDEEGEFSL